MRKITLAAVFIFFSYFGTFSQESKDSTYKKRPLKLEEVNLMSGYYNQDGDNSAVTGGIGTEKLTDFSNTIDIKLSKLDLKNRLHTFKIEGGADTYSSASSDKIDPNTVTSASYSDVRVYPSIAWNVENSEKRTNWGIVASGSMEFDYISKGMGLNFTKTSKDLNREFGIKAGAFFDTWEVILPKELRTPGQYTEGPSPRNSFNLMISLAQVINQRLQIAVVAEPLYQHGLLATSYQRVYFSDNTLNYEKLPDSRWKIPLAVRANYFLGSRVVLRTFYRYYTDQWKISSHTFMLETPVRITPFFTLRGFYRYYSQKGTDYFKPYKIHSSADEFFTSDYDLSTFTSSSFGAGLKYAPAKGVFGIRHLNAAELRYESYSRSTGLKSGMLSLGFKIKPAAK
ncbi:MAG: hypothetical protein A2W91_19450 [Bacteroidetes bacterium GWF2_38_335]|nr:MAG: hypothetical protein A2W91_19450 [Bacteroidetes bacterium GWF2_38_335]OFY79934.1 MAG: hypothetical protein A2281_10850 [Bacteroidetes bacterium RIFOXYA12_FULL_38_20]HBS86392.1 hypothetical protein [Bacteroidales bacterium]